MAGLQAAVLSLPPSGGAWPARVPALLRRTAAGGAVAYAEVAEAVEAVTGLDADDVGIRCRGRSWAKGTAMEVAEEDAVWTVQVVMPLYGGKGGFGSMLRSQGGRMASKQSTNYEACRDLNGRRLKVVSDAKALNEWNEKQETLRREKEEARRRKIDKALAEENQPKKKHFLEDPNYVQATAALVETVASAVDEGLLQNEKVEVEHAAKRIKDEAAVQQASKRLGMWAAPLRDEVAASSSDEDEAPAQAGRA